nr:CotH kinase family protein [Lachnospiraceae bacterium]
MITNKHISKIVAAVTALAVAACFLSIIFSDRLSEAFGGTGVNMEYESRLFDTDEIISVNIIMDQDDWDKMLANATSEEYYACNVVINGETFRNVGIRPKGNTSLSSIAMNPDSDRYSLKLEFGHFVEGQTCHGLDKLILNNNYADATNMKEAIIYDMFQYLGAEASLYNYASVSVNGEYYGVYLALEAVEQSFMLRNFGTQDGELYKPDSMEMGGGNKDGDTAKPSGDSNGFGNFDPSNMPARDDTEKEDKTGSSSGERTSRPDVGGGFGGGFSRGGGGSNLNYTDDELDSYSTIWNSALTGTSKADRRRVVTALKNISEGNDLETYLDVDNVLKYMAVHTFSVNMDSLSGNMSHNYYLYEYKGQLNILPWDYNLCLGGMSMGSSGNASETINDAIDTPFSATHFFDALLENEEYLARYHEYLQQLVDEYVNGGRFEEVYNRIRTQIDSLVETDPTAFYKYDEYDAAAKMLYQTIMLRAESIRGQLAGTIPSTDEGQRKDSSTLVDSSSIDLKVMGEFNMGGNFGSFKVRGDKNKRGRSDSDSESTSESENNPANNDSEGAGDASEPSDTSDESGFPNFPGSS